MPSDVQPIAGVAPPPPSSLPSSSRSLRLKPRSSSSFLALNNVPPVLRPLVRAYILGYASAVAPRLLTLVLQHLSRKTLGKKKYRAIPGHGASSTFTAEAIRILRNGLDVQRFPTFCAILAGASPLLKVAIEKALSHTSSAKLLTHAALERISRWLSAFTAAWIGLALLQSKGLSEAPKSSNTLQSEPSTPGIWTPRTKLAGRTMDLTLFAATRALDVIIGELWSQRKARRQAAGIWTKAEQAISHLADPVMFSISSGLIMWAWFFHPHRLPPSYNKWITSAASVDLRLIEALRRCRNGLLQYGVETGQAPLLGSMCTDYELPLAWGDPVHAIPFPCDIVHMGCGPSCEWHAVSRFVRSWKWSMYTYLPLALLMKARKPSRKAAVQAFLSASRSSAFLGLFITLFYYGVCLARTRVGPHLIGKETKHRQLIDSGVCVGTGCVLCGSSVLIETASRQKDMALFVAPRALATVIPRRYPIEKQWRETLVFAASSAVVFTCVLENPKRVRGVFGRVLDMVMKQ